MLKRLIKKDIERDLKHFPAVAVLGPRQVGKTTLVKQVLEGRPDVEFLDLERPSDLAKLSDAETYLKMKSDKVICIDEVQLRPDLFPLLRVLIDNDRRNGRFLILGSSSPELLRQSSETLAGRIAYNYLTPFTLEELVEVSDWKQILFRGSFPDSILAPSDFQSLRWRENYIQTFLQRDLSLFGINLNPQKMRRLWVMCCHFHGQILNYSKLGQSLDQSHPTINNHIDILESTFMVRRLLPFGINTKKRLVKSPKLYIRDSGILCSLLSIESFDQLYSNPLYGSAWEGYAIEQILSVVNPKGRHGFYRSHAGSEVDLIIETQGNLHGLEFKSSSSPKIDEEYARLKKDLGLKSLTIITPDSDSYTACKGQIDVTSLSGHLEKWRTRSDSNARPPDS